MTTEQFTVQNVKCGGCVQAIQEGLQTIDNVESVEVVIDGGIVTVSGQNLSHATLSEKLSELGYPETA